MNESKVTAAHLRRTAVIYVRQSSLAQVDRNKESTARQYDLAARAQALGWPSGAVRVIDDDLGVSGASTAGRSGAANSPSTTTANAKPRRATTAPAPANSSTAAAPGTCGSAV